MSEDGLLVLELAWLRLWRQSLAKGSHQGHPSPWPHCMLAWGLCPAPPSRRLARPPAPHPTPAQELPHWNYDGSSTGQVSSSGWSGVMEGYEPW